MALRVLDTIAPANETRYASHMAKFGLGGYREVQTIAERDAIGEVFLEDGCVCYVRSGNTEYRWNGMTKQWEEITIGLPDGLLERIYEILEKLEDKFSITGLSVNGQGSKAWYEKGVSVTVNLTWDYVNQGEITSVFVNSTQISNDSKTWRTSGVTQNQTYTVKATSRTDLSEQTATATASIGFAYKWFVGKSKSGSLTNISQFEDTRDGYITGSSFTFSIPTELDYVYIAFPSSYSISSAAAKSGGIFNDFVDPITFTYTLPDNTSVTYKLIRLNPKQSDSAGTSFTIYLS